MAFPLYLGGIVAALAIGLLMFQAGRLVLMRSNAQTAADAAALAGAREIARQCRIQERIPRHGPCRHWELIDPPIIAAARQYAARNGASSDVSVRRQEFDVLIELGTDDKLGEEGRRIGAGYESRGGDASSRATALQGSSGGFGLASASLASRGPSTTALSAAALSTPALSKGPDRTCEDVVKFGHQLQEEGFQVGENAALGDPPAAGVHVNGSWHYRCGGSGALDVNCDGCPGGEPAVLSPLADRARSLGFNVLWQVAGHFDHVHVDPGSASGATLAGLGGGSAALASLGGSLAATFGLGALGLGGGGYDPHLVAWDGRGGGLPSGAGSLIAASAASRSYAAPPAGADPIVVNTACTVAVAARLSPKETLALFEAGIVESGMRNLAYGDSSSVGWLQLLDIHGSFAQRMDPMFAAMWFVGGLSRLDEDDYATPGRLAQAVQRSAFPDRYDQVEGQARALIESRCRGAQYA
jgi:hypothetical protein